MRIVPFFTSIALCLLAISASQGQDYSIARTLLPGSHPVLHFTLPASSTDFQIQNYVYDAVNRTFTGSVTAYPIATYCTLQTSRRGGQLYQNCLYPLGGTQISIRFAVRGCVSGFCEAAFRPEADLSCLCGAGLSGCPDTVLPTAKTPLLPPSADATNLVAVATSGRTIDLTWTDNSCNEQGFIIQRSLSSNGPYAEVGRCVRPEFHDDNLQPLTTYYYRVTPF